jgi:hypothetical protein
MSFAVGTRGMALEALEWDMLFAVLTDASGQGFRKKS